MGEARSTTSSWSVLGEEKVYHIDMDYCEGVEGEVCQPVGEPWWADNDVRNERRTGRARDRMKKLKINVRQSNFLNVTITRRKFVDKIAYPYGTGYGH